ncbi:MAG: hypothetical protein U1E76_16845 [Planctomycetota bacterium]
MKLPTVLVVLLGLMTMSHAGITERPFRGCQGDELDKYSGGMPSADGRWVALSTYATNLACDDHNQSADVFVLDRTSGFIERVSVATDGTEANDDSYLIGLSADARLVCFMSWADNLVAGDTNGVVDVFVHEVATGVTSRVNLSDHGDQANDESYGSQMSADGSFVVFYSYATNLVPEDRNGVPDVFVRDLLAGTTTRESVDSSGAEGNGPSGDGLGAAICAGGRYVAFYSQASNLVGDDTNGFGDVFIRDRLQQLTSRVSVSSSGEQANWDSWVPSISDDGSLVAFGSRATNLIPDDTNNQVDVFVRNTLLGTTRRVNVSSSGAQANGSSFSHFLAGAGRYVAFSSYATNLVDDDHNGREDVFIHDLLTERTSLVSRTYDREQANEDCYAPRLSSDARIASFVSEATNLVPDDALGIQDLFLRIEWSADRAQSTSYGDGWPGTLGVPLLTSEAPALCLSCPIDVGNSRGQWTVALMFLGLDRADLPTAWDGHLLVAPLVAFPIAVPPAGAQLVPVLPCDRDLGGMAWYLQVLIDDPGASRGVAFTPGLQLVLGD